ncbi:hypothetical protein [Streptomyces sp. NPDC047928]|uniref:hypothetical protein n=1 Tax=unclassified Streptomyces TaxID=2593676 RepID=UPI00371ECECC
MRMMLQATMDTEKGNELIRSGRMPELLGEMMRRLQPEAAYFTAEHGCRSCLMVFDMEDPSQLVTISEPLFMELGAEVVIQPTMNVDDVERGLAAFQG